MDKYIYSVGLLDNHDREIKEVHISAKNKEEMWERFDKMFGKQSNGVIYGCDPA